MPCRLGSGAGEEIRATCPVDRVRGPVTRDGVARLCGYQPRPVDRARRPDLFAAPEPSRQGIGKCSQLPTCDITQALTSASMAGLSSALMMPALSPPPQLAAVPKTSTASRSRAAAATKRLVAATGWKTELCRSVGAARCPPAGPALPARCPFPPCRAAPTSPASRESHRQPRARLARLAGRPPVSGRGRIAARRRRSTAHRHGQALANTSPTRRTV